MAQVFNAGSGGGSGGGGLQLLSIEITTPPNKTTYKSGEMFDSTGMVVTAKYFPNIENVVTGYVVTPQQMTDGITEVTVEYSERRTKKTATQPVTVIPILDSIAVTKSPNKTEYTYLETFDKTGMIVTAISTDGSQKTVTNYTCETPTFTTIGTQSITISYTEDGITKTTAIQVNVSEKPLAIPAQSDTLTYTGATLTPTWSNYDSEKMTIGGRTSAINAGQYSATFTLEYGYKWSDGTKEPKSITWEIGRAVIAAVPTQSAGLSYDGTEKTPSWTGYDPDKMTIDGVTSATDVGTYTVTFTPTNNYQWFDGTTTAKEATWEITNIIVSIPTTKSNFTYNGNAQSPVWDNFDSEHSEISGQTSATDAGTYTTTFTLLTGAWTDGTTDPKNIQWTIKRANIAATPVQSGSLTYNGSIQSPTWNNYNTAQLSLAGDTSGTNAGSYIATFTPTKNYQWNNGTTTAKSITWTINRATVNVPTQNGTLTYTGSAQSPNWNGYNAAQLTIGGTTSATNAGTYNATFTPTSNYQWSDGSITAKTVSWSIAKATVSLPTQSGSLTYNGNSQSPIWSGYDSGKLTLGGTTSGTNAGNYTATFTPKTNYQWSDGSVTAKNATWKINKAAGSLSLNKTSLSLNASTKTGTITVTRAGDGAITATSSSTNVATVSVSGTTVTVTAVGSGSSTITVKVAEGTNHTAPANKTISVTAALANVFGVCWDMSNSSTALTRLTPSNDPNGLVTVNITTNPSPAVGTGAGSSPFDNYSPWKDMDEYNIVNNAVSHKRGSSSFSRTNYNTMVYVPTFYYRIFDSNGKRYFYISDTAISGFTKHPGSNKYVGRYNIIAGTNTSLSRVAVPGGDIPASASGHSPRVSLTRAAFREAARSKGDKWSLYDYVTWCAVWLLYLIEFADWNSQAKIGQGIVSASAAQNTGGTDTMSYHTGRAAGTDGQTAVQYRHIENPWGNVYEWIDGINFDDRTVRVCTDPAKYADDTTTDYMVASTITGSNGFIKSLGSSTNAPYAFLPNAVGGSNSTYIPDYYYQNTGWRVLRVGGLWNFGLPAGLFYFRADNTSSYSSSVIGARLLYHP